MSKESQSEAAATSHLDAATDLPASTPESSSRPRAGGAALGVSPRDVFKRVYRLLHSKLLGVILFLAMAVLGLIGTLVMQAPMSKYQNRAAYQQWLPQAEQKYGALTGIFDFLGFFSLWSSPLFLAVTVLLALSIIACTTHRLPLLVAKTTRPRLHVSDRFFFNAQYRATVETSINAEDAATQLRDVLGDHRLRVLEDPQDQCHRFYADKHRFGPFGTVIAHASFVIILAAFAVSAFTGFETTLDLPIGLQTPVGNGSNLSVTATSFKDDYDAQGRPTDYVSHLVVSRDGTAVKEQDVRVNSPIVVDGVRFHQASFGIAAVITVAGADGGDLGQHAVALKWTSNDGKNSVGRLDLPQQDREIIVATPASGQRNADVAAGTAIVEVYQISSGERLDAGPIDQGNSLSLADLQITFDREAQYTGILVRQDPGTWWMWVGSALLIIGMTMTFGFRFRRFWARIEESDEGAPTRIHLATVDEPDSILDRQFRELVGDLSNRCNPQKEGSDA